MLSPEQEASIIALCERIGMPWEKAPSRADTEHPWNGTALNVAHYVYKHASPTSDLVHDVAHWLVAAPERRHEEDFGLDRMAYFRESLSPKERGLSPSTSMAEEIDASLLGILLERAMGMDWRYTWEVHSWDCEGWAGLRPAIRALRQRGLIQGLVPTCLLGATSGLKVR